MNMLVGSYQHVGLEDKEEKPGADMVRRLSKYFVSQVAGMPLQQPKMVGKRPSTSAVGKRPPSLADLLQQKGRQM